MRIKRVLYMIAVSLILASCGDDNGTHTTVKPIEHKIYLNVKAFRVEMGLSGPFVEQYIVVREAQLYSYKMANGIEEVGLQGMDEHYTELNEKLGLYNFHSLVLKTDTQDEDQILSELLLIPGADSTLMEDLTQCGVGVEFDAEGFVYVTVMMAKAD